MDQQRQGAWMNTATGKQAFILDPHPDDVDIEDIALALAKLCRFGGHVRRNVWHYSVAQHSVLVSYVCEPQHALIGLLHDAAEAYVGDVIRPMKDASSDREFFRGVERGWASAIGQRYGVGDALAHLPPDVKRADWTVLATERRDLIDHKGRPWQVTGSPLAERIEAWPAEIAYNNFMGRFGQLINADDARRYVP